MSEIVKRLHEEMQHYRRGSGNPYCEHDNTVYAAKAEAFDDAAEMVIDHEKKIGWQLINDAPKDGTEIDLWRTFADGTGERVADGYWDTAGLCWRTSEANYAASNITHFMLIPSGPV